MCFLPGAVPAMRPAHPSLYTLQALIEKPEVPGAPPEA
jgi:hypothetical protein